MIGLVSLRTGYRAVLRNAVAGLEHETARIVNVIETQWESVLQIARTCPDNGVLPPESIASLPDYLQSSGAQLADPETQVELRHAAWDSPRSAGSLFAGLGDVPRPEVEAAARVVPAYALRRLDGILVLYLSSAVPLGGYEFLVSVASDQSGLDE